MLCSKVLQTLYHPALLVKMENNRFPRGSRDMGGTDFWSVKVDTTNIAQIPNFAIISCFLPHRETPVVLSAMMSLRRIAVDVICINFIILSTIFI